MSPTFAPYWYFIDLSNCNSVVPINKCRLFRRERDRPGRGDSRDRSPNAGSGRGSSRSHRSHSRTPTPSRVTRSPRHARRDRSSHGRGSPSRDHRDKRYLSCLLIHISAHGGFTFKLRLTAFGAI